MAWTRHRPTGLVYRDPKLADPGYTLFSSVRGQHATLVDDEGRIVHRWQHEPGIQYGRLLANGNLLLRSLPPYDGEGEGVEQIGGSSAALYELDWDGNVVWEYHNPMLHHDFYRLDNGNHLVLLWRKLPQAVHERVQGGHHHEEDPELMWGDVVQEITPEGKPVREWRSWEHLDFDEDVICPLESRKEWTHLNSIDVTPRGDWLLSFRLTSSVGLVDPESGSFRWKWGPEELSHQHHASMLDNGNVLILDNGCHRRRGPSFSKVVEVDPDTDEVVWSYTAEVMLAFFSFMVSGAQRLPGGNTFITEGATGRMFEITPQGETVWEYVSSLTYESRFGPSPAIFRAHRYPLDDPRLADRELDPDRYAEETRAVASGETPY